METNLHLARPESLAWFPKNSPKTLNRQAEVTAQDSDEWNELFSIDLVKLLSKESLLRREEASSINPTLWQRLD